MTMEGIYCFQSNFVQIFFVSDKNYDTVLNKKTYNSNYKHIINYIKYVDDVMNNQTTYTGDIQKPRFF